jgi:hypothetical protein
MQRRIWAKKGGRAERPFEDSGAFDALTGTAPSRQQSGELGRPSKAADAAQIVDLPPTATPPPMVSPLRQQPPPKTPPRAEEGPVVVLAPPRSASSPARPVAEPSAAATPSRRPTSAHSTPARVQIAAPSADGVVISRPSSLVASGTLQSGAPARPVPPVAHPVASRPTGPYPQVGTAGGPSPPTTGKTGKPPSAPRESPADSIFGEDLISEKSLDEVILAYLAEDAKHPK